MYVYLVENLINGKIYVGQTIRNEMESKRYYGSGKLIKHAINKYGKCNFQKQVLKRCKNKKRIR